MPYAAPSDLTARYDLRTVSQLASDNNVAVPDVTAAPAVLAVLSDASGDVDVALMAGGRYTAADLAALTGNSLATLLRIVCDIAMSYLYARRPGFDVKKTKELRELADDHLDRLRKGENVFALPAQISAGQPTIDGPTAVEYEAMNLTADRARRGYFPARNLPFGRG